MNRTTLDRFDILADATSFSPTDVAMMTPRFGKGIGIASCAVMRCRW